jgi:REP element-mobilizing transposase RayT
MANTLGIHWAVTTHGAWLHGDFRGSWKSGRLIGPDPFLEAECRARMNGSAVMLDAVERAMVARQFGQVVCERGHRVLAATVQATHVHLVFAPLQESVDKVFARLKRRSAAAVLGRRRERQDPAKMAGLYSRAILARKATVPRSLWTSGKFPVFIFDEWHLINAIEYVRDHNRRVGLAADSFDWIDPLYPASGVLGERCGHSCECEYLL